LFRSENENNHDVTAHQAHDVTSEMSHLIEAHEEFEFFEPMVFDLVNRTKMIPI
jgi:hypothetical protein